MKTGKRILATFLVVWMLLASAPITGLTDFFVPKVEAANLDYKVGDYIQYGNYPQSKVTDSTILNVLNSKTKKWISYGYYSGSGSISDGQMKPSDYMRYADIDTDGDGLRDYRAVTFDKYRQYATGYTAGDSNTYQDKNGYTPNNVYYFKYEPLSWRVLNPSTGLVMCTRIVDNQAYNNFILTSGTVPEDGYTAYYGDAGKNYYANDYYNSSLRQWLNADFYNTAFTSSQAANIRNDVKLNNNSFSSSYSQYNSKACKDKIFLLSFGEARTSSYGFSSSSTYSSVRQARGTDYAKCQGGLDSSSNTYSLWWLRSPGEYSRFSCLVDASGYINNYDIYMINGIRPACRLSSLKSDISKSKIGNNIGSGAEGGNTTIAQSEYWTGDETTTVFKITPRHKNEALSGSFAKWKSGDQHAQFASAKIKAGGKTYDFTNSILDKIGGYFNWEENSIEIKYEEAKGGFTVCAEGFYDHIVPAEVAESFIHKTMSNIYSQTVYLSPDEKDGKPVISSAYAKVSGYNESYSDIIDSGSSFSISSDTDYDIIVSGTNIKGDVTYWLSQDSSRRISSKTGRFSAKDIFDKKFDKSRTIYAYVESSNGVSRPVATKLKIVDVEDNGVIKALRTGSVSLGGSSFMSVKLPNDWVLVGGKSIDMGQFVNCPVSLDVGDDGRIKIAIGVGKDYFDNKKTMKEADKKYGNDKEGLMKDLVTQVNSYKAKWADCKDNKAAYNDMKAIAKKLTGKENFIYSAKEIGWDANVLGYVEGYYRNGTVTFTAGSICLSGKLSASYDWQGNGWVCGISGGVEASANGKYAREIPDTNFPLEFDFTLNVKPFLKLYGGVGIQKVATADVYGKAYLPFNWTPTANYWDIALQGEIGVEAKVFIFKTGEIPVLEGTLGPYTHYYGSSKTKVKALAPSVKTPLVSQSYEYTGLKPAVREESSWLGSTSSKPKSKAKATGTTQAGVSITTLAQNVFDNSNVQVISLGDKALAVWVSDNSSRDEYNYAELVYSVYDSDTARWSEPQTVAGDGYIDFAPTLATDGTNVYVAWQKLCKKFDATNSSTTSELLKYGEIYLAQYDASVNAFKTASRLTNDEYYDYSPSVAVLNGKPVVTYATSLSNSLNCINGNILKQYNNGNTTTLKNALPSLYNLETSVLDGKVQIVYAVDTDDDIQTTDDISMYTGTTEFSLIEKPLSEVSMMNATFAEFNGKNTLFVSDGFNIYYFLDNELKPIFEENTLIQGKISAVKSPTGLAIFWTNQTDLGNEIFTCTYADGKWSKSVQVTERNSMFTNLAVSNVGNKIVGLANETMREYDSETESYVSGNTNLISFVVNDFIDLTANTLTVDESELVLGGKVLLPIAYENNGNISSDGVKVTVSTEGFADQTAEIEETLVPGDENSIDFEYTVPADYSGETITAKIEDISKTDADNTDNTVSYTCDTAMLVSGAEEIQKTSDGYIVGLQVANKNFTTAEGVKISAYLTDPEDEDATPIGVLPSKNLPHDEIASVEFYIMDDSIEFDENDTAYIWIVASADNSPEYITSLAVSPNTLTCGHPLTEDFARIAPTCTENGCESSSKCTACGEYVSGGTVIPKTGHTSDNGTVTTQSTCTADGIKTYNCTACGEAISTETVAKLGHKYDAVVTAPTCTSKGYTTHTCVVCKYTYTDSEEASLSHTTDNGTVTAQPTCTTEGEKVYKCITCGETLETEIVPATNHPNKYGTKGVSATCTEDGITAGTYCPDCKQYLDGHEVIKATDHRYEATTIEPTCIEDGSILTKCTVCGDVKSNETLKATGHTKYVSKAAVDATCKTAGNTVEEKCSVCGTILTASRIINALGHKSDSGTVTKAATCTATGTKTYKCTVCKEVLKTETIVKTSHTVVNDKAVAPTCIKEGKTAGSHCSVCGTVITAQTTIAKLNHTDNNHDGYCDECGTKMQIDNPSTNCSCNCHKSGFGGFIWKIQRFFWKLFKTHQICECGITHY